MQILELPERAHPYFIAGQFHPELTSRPLHPQPMFMGLVAAAVLKKYGSTEATRADLLADATLARWIRRGGEAVTVPSAARQPV